MKKLKSLNPKAQQFDRTLAGLGNLNILSNHIEKLRERLEKLQEPLSASSNLDYYCWLLLNANFVFHMIEYKYFRYHAEKPITEHIRVDELIRSLKKDFKKTPDYNHNNWRYIHAVIELRHRLAHVGIPNIVVEPIRDPKYLNTIIFNGDLKQAKRYFAKVREFLNTMVDPVIILPGFAQIGM